MKFGTFHKRLLFYLSLSIFISLFAPVQSKADERPDIVWETLGHDGFIGALAFYPDGTRLVTGGRDTLVKIWNVSDGALQLTLPGHTEMIESIAVSSDGNLIASAGGFDRTVRIWDGRNGSLLKKFSLNLYCYSVMFSPDGNLFLVSGSGGTPQIRRTTDGSLVRTMEDTLFSSDGLWRIATRFDPSSPSQYTTSIFRATSGSLWDNAGDALQIKVPYSGGPISPGNTFFLASHGPASQENPLGSTLTLVRMKDGTDVASFVFPPRGDPGNPIRWIDGRAFSPDLGLIGAISGSTRVLDPGPYAYITLWKTSDGSIVKFYQDEMSRTAYGSLPFTFSPDGQFFTYSRGEGTIVLARTPELKPRLKVRREGQKIILSWSATAAGFVLERTQSSTVTSWEKLSTVSTLMGDQRVVVLDIDHSAQYYRLREE